MSWELGAGSWKQWKSALAKLHMTLWYPVPRWGERLVWIRDAANLVHEKPQYRDIVLHRIMKPKGDPSKHQATAQFACARTALF